MPVNSDGSRVELADSSFNQVRRGENADLAIRLFIRQHAFGGMNIMRVRLLLIAGIALLAAAPVSARERLLNPVTDWQVTKQDESCLLVRDFADQSGDQIRLNMHFFGSSNKFQITMIGPGLPLRAGVRRGVARIRYRFKPDPDWRDSYGATGYSNGQDLLTFTSNLSTKAEADRESLETDLPDAAASERARARAAQVQQISLAYPSRDDTVLQLGTLSEPFAKIEDCVRSMIGDWGYDPDALDGLQTGPNMLNQADIAGILIQRLQQAKLGSNFPVTMRFDIDANGSATSCKIQHPNRNNEVETLICNALREKAQFAPAKDAEGRGVPAPYSSTVVFAVQLW